MSNESLRVVIFREGDAWVAQCLEFDIYAKASNLDDLRARMIATLDAEASYSRSKGRQPFAGIDPAPQHYQAMWDQRSSFSKPERLAGGDDEQVELALVA